MGQVINYTRLTTSDKLDDRFLTCQVYEPVDPEQVKSGIIFSQIEILNPWFPTSQIGQTVINTLIREYYRGNDTSDLVNFENAVKKVNEALAQIAQNGETDWIGKFSGILALVNKDEIHIAQTGQSQAYLFRGSKANHITEGLGSSEPPHPLKTFTNLTSGNLQEGDKIIIGNSTLFAVYSPGELKIPISSYRPTLSAIEIARGLKRHGAKNGNAIIIELTTKDELANIPPEQKLDTIYLDKGGFDFITSIRSFFSLIYPMFLGAGKTTAKMLRSSKDALAPKVKSTIVASQKGLAKVSQNATKLKQEAREKVATIPASNNEKYQNDEISSEHIHEKNEIINNDSDKKPYLKKNFLKLKNRFRRVLIATGLYSSNRPKMIATVMYIVVGILVITLGYTIITRNQRANDKSLREKSTQITSLSGDAAIAISKEDEDEALRKYLEILRLANDIKDTKYENETKEIVEKARTKVKEISRLNIIEPVKQYKIEGDVLGLTSIDDSLVYYKNNEGTFLKKALESSFNVLSSQKLESPVVSSVSIENENKIIFLLSNKKIKSVGTNDRQVNDHDVELEGGIELKEFSGNLYVLDPGSNQIWKVVSEGGNYNTASGYIKDETIIDNSVDLAIDGSIYVLNRDCHVIKFSRGNQSAEFTIKLPANQEFKNCKAVASGESSNSIFIANEDGGKIKIVEIKKNGDFVGQFELNGSNDSKNILINTQRREAIVQTSSQIITYKF